MAFLTLPCYSYTAFGNGDIIYGTLLYRAHVCKIIQGIKERKREDAHYIIAKLLITLSHNTILIVLSACI